MTTSGEYTRDDRERVAVVQQRVSEAILPMLASAESRGQAFVWRSQASASRAKASAGWATSGT